MRPGAQFKQGYYPLHPENVDAILRHLFVENPKSVHSILDPCAGEGAALTRLAAGIPGSVPYANEIDPKRFARITAERRCCGPVEHLRATNNAFSLLYLNPPFDNDGQGDRVEGVFFTRCIDYVKPGGVVVFVIAETAHRTVAFSVDSHCEGKWFKAVAGHRPFKELIFVGKVRPEVKYVFPHWIDPDDFPEIGSTGDVWAIPPSEPIKQYRQTYVDPVLVDRAMERSPVWKRLAKPVDEDRRIEAPCPLSAGHTGLALAAGVIDGVVDFRGTPLLIKGCVRKEQFTTEEYDEETKTKTTRTREFMRVGIHALGSDGSRVELK